MKRLNKKGFTLVELLAVIIILAVVVGITIPAVLSTVDSAKESAFETASKTAADWFDREYQAYLVSNEAISPVNDQFEAAVTAGVLTSAQTFTVTNNAALFTAAGLTPSNFTSMSVTFSDGRFCVVLTSAAGDYKTSKYPAGSTSTAGGSCTPSDIGIEPKK